MKLKKILAGAVALTLVAGISLSVPSDRINLNNPSTLTINAAAGEEYPFAVDTTATAYPRANDAPDPNGLTGFLLENTTDKISAVVEVEETGMYDIILSCQGIGGDKVINMAINGGNPVSISVPAGTEYTEVNMGAFKLTEGENTIEMTPSWTWAAFSYAKAESSVLPEVKTGFDVSLLSNPNATRETLALMDYLAYEVYTQHILSGQQEVYAWGRQDGNGGSIYDWDFDYIEENTGKLPAIRAVDMLNYASPCNGEEAGYGYNDGTIDRMIEWVNEKGGITTASWHITVPKDFQEGYEIGERIEFENYTYKRTKTVPDSTKEAPETDFIAANAVVEGTKENEYYNIALDKVAEGFQILEDEGVPVIWRPLHEAQGAWFWWSSEGAEVYVDIWQYTYDYLVNEKGLDNLIWEWNAYDQPGNEDWYPGDEYVDLVGFDKYNAIDTDNDWNGDIPNESAISSTFYNLVKSFGQKMISIPENDTIPAVQNLLDEKAYWLYFCTWYEDPQGKAAFLTKCNDVDTLNEIYNSDYCLTLDELGDWKNYTIDDDIHNTPPTTSTTKITTTEPTEPTTAPTEPTKTTVSPRQTEVATPWMKIPGDVDCDDKVQMADIVLLCQGVAAENIGTVISRQGRANADVLADHVVDSADISALASAMVNSMLSTLPITPENNE